LIRFIKILHLLSFDVVLGAVVCNVMFWKLQTKPPEYSFLVTFILGLSVWIIYVLDRILDNQKSALIFTERHLFHQTHQRILWFSVITFTVICAGLLFFVPFNIIKFGIIISSITGCYLLIINKISSKNSLQYFKEPVTAFVYTAAVWGTATLHQFDFTTIFLGLIFMLIAFQNLLLFSYFELKNFPKTNNLAQFLGKKSSKYIIFGIFFSIVIVSGFSFVILESAYQYKVLSVEILMSFSLVLIIYFQDVTLRNDRFRWMSDGIFLLPILIIL
jgi:hypothetical protein